MQHKSSALRWFSGIPESKVSSQRDTISGKAAAMQEGEGGRNVVRMAASMKWPARTAARSSARISEAEEGEKKLEIVCMLREARMAREKGQGARVR